MPFLASFLPPHLLGSLARRRRRQLPYVERLPAALLFSDVSGFTALSERLQERGREGAEEIARVINRAFRPAIRAIESQAGSIVCFGGDALFALFTGAGRVGRAVAAAEEVRARVARWGSARTSAGRVRLGVSQAVHHGTVVAMDLGREGERHHLVVGPAVRALARLQGRARAGEIRLSGAARAQRSREGRSRRRWIGISGAASRASSRAYLDARLVEALAGFAGAYRRVAILFLETEGASPRKLQAWLQGMTDALERYEGLLLKSDLSARGTKWIAAFGIPAAHEGDPDRAARAALEALGSAPRGLAVRGGLHAGTVVNVLVGTTTRRSFDVMGDVVNTAARAMAAAPRGEILVTEDCRNCLAGVETADRGRHAAKGKSVPLHLHALVRAAAAVKPMRVAAPMIGRDRELAAIVASLGRAKAGRGCVIGIGGEAGLGKSRLVYEAALRARDVGFEVHEGRAVAFGGMPYGAIGSLLKHALGLPEVAERASILETVAAAARRLGLGKVDRDHLAEILGARFEDAAVDQLKPDDVRVNNMVAVRACCQALARVAPRMLVLEDMHWADGASVEAAAWLAKGVSDVPVVLMLLHRPGYEPPRGAEQLGLADLGGDAIGQILEAQLGRVRPAVGRLVEDRAGGNPFYVEELVRHLLESGLLRRTDEGYQLLRDPEPDDLPGTIESLIAARLDRLAADVKSVAQHAAVIGRGFLLELVARLPEIAGWAASAVEKMEAREIVLVKASRPRLEYAFKHALTRDVAYGSVLVARRRRMHRAVADAIEGVLGRDGFEAMLGHHRELAGERRLARGSYLAGARRAAAMHAHEEAERLYGSYLRLVDAPTAESITARHELAERVLTRRGRMAEAEAEHGRAREEACRLGDRGLEGASVRSLGVVCSRTGRPGEALAHYERALAIARETGDRGREAFVLGDLANLSRESGRPDDARGLHERALALHREVGDRPGEGIALGNLGALHVEQGRLDEARRLYEEALTIHRDVGSRGIEGVVLGNLGILAVEQGRPEEALALYEEALAIHREVGSRRSESIVLGNLGALHAEQGRRHRAIALYEEALALHREVGDRRLEGNVLGNMGVLLQEQGRSKDAVALYEEALSIHRAVGNRRSEGIVLGNLGDLLLEQGSVEAAGGLHEQALAAARDVGDRRLEGIALGNLAAWQLLAGVGPGEESSSLAAEGALLLVEVGDRSGLGKLRCTEGHLAAAAGLDPFPCLERAREAAAGLAGGPQGPLGRDVAKLERAGRAFLEGRPLLRGFVPEDLSEGQRRWLRANHPEAIAREIMRRLRRDGTWRRGRAPTRPAAAPGRT